MTDTSSGQPYWFKEALEQLGLLTGGFKGKRVAVPNMTHYTSLIYKFSFFWKTVPQPILLTQVKHMVRVTPVTFPNGVPSVNDFDPSMARVTGMSTNSIVTRGATYFLYLRPKRADAVYYTLDPEPRKGVNTIFKDTNS